MNYQELVDTERAKGRTVADIAKQLGVPRTSLYRLMKRTAQPLPLFLLPDEKRRMAVLLLEEGCPYGEVARTVGVPVKELRHQLPGYAQPSAREMKTIRELERDLGLRDKGAGVR